MNLSLKHTLLSFLVGIMLLPFLLFILNVIGLPRIPHDFVLYGAVLEEILKFTAIIALIFMFGIKPLNTATLGMGFGFGEGLYHLMCPDKEASLIALFMHSIVGFVMVWFVYKATKSKRKKIAYPVALLCPMFLHAFYNSYLVYFIVYLLMK